MASRRRRPAKRKNKLPNKLTLTNVLLVVVIVILLAYIFYPVVTKAVSMQPFGDTLQGINSPLGASELAVINGAPNSYFQNAGEALLNQSLEQEGVYNTIYYAPNFILNLSKGTIYPTFTYQGRPSVIYVGAISCIYCGENRWAMALALSRFGNFTSLYTGYSSINDGDVPTLYWLPQNLQSDGATFGNDYNSKYINFFSAEYDSNITQGFQFPSSQYPISYFVARAPNASYESAMSFMNSTNQFVGTPFTFWGTSLNKGAVGVVFGTPPNNSSSSPGLTFMTHQQLLGQLKSLNSTVAYEEYAAADVYIAQICPTINNAAQVCSLPAIQEFEQKMGLS